MSDDFDPYFKWLGIPPDEQPPNHYRLLGIPLFVDDADVIQAAADQRMMLLRSYQAGSRSDLSQKLLNEVSNAKVCLLKISAKAEYDADLRASFVDDSVTLEPVDDNFDPYYAWLGISPANQPPNAFQLLNVSPHETDPDAINNAARQRLSQLQSRSEGLHAESTNQLVHEISSARSAILLELQRSQAAKSTDLDVQASTPQVNASDSDAISRIRKRRRAKKLNSGWRLSIASGLAVLIVIVLVAIGLRLVNDAGRAKQKTSRVNDDSAIAPIDKPAPVDQEPKLDFQIHQLIRNSGCEEIQNNKPVGWELDGARWSPYEGGIGLAVSPPDGGRYFFYGGHRRDSPSHCRQIASIPASLFGPVDQGHVRYSLSAYLGGWEQQPDHASVTALFKAETDSLLGAAKVGPVTREDRESRTGWIFREHAGLLPPKTRRIEVVLEFTYFEGGANNDGYADNIVIELMPASSSNR